MSWFTAQLLQVEIKTVANPMQWKMKIGPRFYLLFVYFESSLTNKRDNFVDLQKTDLNDRQASSQEIIQLCETKDLDLPRNGDKWFCNKVITGYSHLVPKNAKCYLKCEEGYDVRSRKSIAIIIGLSCILTNQIIWITLNVQ